jgi:hypothetical protein
MLPPLLGRQLALKGAREVNIRFGREASAVRMVAMNQYQSPTSMIY